MENRVWKLSCSVETQKRFCARPICFPGGAVDVTDRATDEIETISIGLNDREASARLQIDSGGLSYWVAAIRECFEEAEPS